MSFGLYELAWQFDLQTKLRTEIKNTLQASKGELTYDDVNGMVYLNMVVQGKLELYKQRTAGKFDTFRDASDVPAFAILGQKMY